MNRRRASALILITATTLTAIIVGVRAQPSAETGTPAVPQIYLLTDTPTYAGCAYLWAYRDLPEVSAQFDLAIKELFPQASGRAQAFGEDCVFADGHAEFEAMETDFYVTVPVDDLTDPEALGNRMAAVMMMILDRFPSETLPGGQDGFVEFRFEDNEADFLIVRVPIQKYKNEAAGKTGTELFRMFYQNP